MSDYRTLLAEQFGGNSPNRTCNGAYMDVACCNEAARIFATRVPWLCPDCEGSGKVEVLGARLMSDSGWTTERCTHPNAPTIADLLRWGENVAKARVVKGHMNHRSGCVHVGDYCLDADDVGLLAALRREGQ